MTRELIINGQRIEASDVRIALNYQRNKIGEILIAGSGSQTIKILKTIANMASFGYCNFVESESVYPYTIQAARYYEDGVLIVDNAEFTILRTTPDAFECVLTWDNSSMLNPLKAIYMSEIDLQVYAKYPFYRIADPLLDERVVIESRRLLDPQLDGTVDEYFNTLVTRNPLGFNRAALPTAINLGTTIGAIARAAVPIVVAPYDPAIENFLENAYIPMTTREATIPNFKISIKKAAFDVTLRSRQVAVDGFGTVTYGAEAIRLINDDFSAYQIDEPNDWDNNVDDPSTLRSLRDYYIPETGWYDLYLEGAYSQAAAPFSDFTSFIFARYLVCSAERTTAGPNLYVAAAQESLSDVEATYTTVGSVVWFRFEENDEVFRVSRPRVYLIKGRYGFWMTGQSEVPNIPAPDLSTDYAYTDVSIELTITASDTRPVKVKDEQVCWLNSNFVFGNVTAHYALSELLKAIGARVQIQENNGDLEMQLYTYNTLAQNAADGVCYDWSNKVLGKEDALEYAFDTTKNMLLKWADDEQYEGGSDYLFHPLALSEEVKTYLQNAMVSQGNGEFLADGYTIPTLDYVGLKKEAGVTQEAFDYPNKMRLVYLQGARPTYHPNLYWTNQQGGLDVDMGGVKGSLCALCTTAEFDYSDLITGIGANFKALIDALYRINFIQVPMRLLPTDIINLDFKKPIYLRQYGAYFALEKMQYGADGISKVELIKLNLQ